MLSQGRSRRCDKGDRRLAPSNQTTASWIRYARGWDIPCRDISASQGHIVPTAIAFHNGNFYVGNLNTFPIVQGSSKVLKITATGQITVLRGNLTTILGLAFDSAGRLYVLENTTGNQFPTPGTGKVIRIELTGNRTLIASGLFLPTAMTFGPDGALYVSNVGFGPPPNGLGQVLRITIP